MKKNDKYFDEARLVPFHIIEAASKGDVGAINFVLKHYEKYIAKLSTRRWYDEYGNSHNYVDNDLRKRLVTKLLDKILSFNVEM